MPDKFRSKVVEIEALKWTGDNSAEVEKFVPEGKLNWSYAGERELFLWNDQEVQFIRCPEGHWIIKGLEGEFYPCSPKVFEQKYEQLDKAPEGVLPDDVVLKEEASGDNYRRD